MSEPLVEAEREALEYLYGGGDEEIECRSMAWVHIRYPQQCLSIMHRAKLGQQTDWAPAVFPVGTRMVIERAKVDGKFGSCYTCESCIHKAQKELCT